MNFAPWYLVKKALLKSQQKIGFGAFVFIITREQYTDQQSNNKKARILSTTLVYTTIEIIATAIGYLNYRKRHFKQQDKHSLQLNIKESKLNHSNQHLVFLAPGYWWWSGHGRFHSMILVWWLVHTCCSAISVGFAAFCHHILQAGLCRKGKVPWLLITNCCGNTWI